MPVLALVMVDAPFLNEGNAFCFFVHAELVHAQRLSGFEVVEPMPLAGASPVQTAPPPCTTTLNSCVVAKFVREVEVPVDPTNAPHLMLFEEAPRSQ